MSAPVITALQAVRERLANPRAWLQGVWCGRRDAKGHVTMLTTRGEINNANCWCLSEAISIAVGKTLDAKGLVQYTELRSDVEMELLNTLGALGIWVPAVHQWNDRPTTSHADVLGLVDATLARLDNVVRDPALEAIYDEVEALAEADAKAGIAGRQLEPRLAEYQAEYEEYFLVTRTAPPSN